jgi:glucokinase
VVKKMVAGVDVGGSTIKACTVDEAGKIVSAVLPTTLGSPTDLGDLVVTAVSAALSETRSRMSDLTAIGIGVPGEVARGRVRNAANLGIDDDGYDLAGYVSTATGVDTSVENDMTVAAFGAFTRLSAEEPALHNLVYIGLGTGVAAGVVLNRKVFRGSRALAGEFGHVPMGTGLDCPCGSVGCLETVMGANGLRVAWEGGITTTLFAAADDGDRAARQVIDRAIGFLATAMWWLAAAYDPDYFLIGGGLGVNNPSIKDLITARWGEMSARSALARRVLDPNRIRISDLEEPVGAYGAALLAAGDAGRAETTNPESNWEEETRK